MSLPRLSPIQPSQNVLNRQVADAFNMLVKASRAKGTTAERPAIGRAVAQFYFDTDLGRPIWWNGSAWIDAAGTPV